VPAYDSLDMYVEGVESGLFVRERTAGAPRVLWVHGLGDSGAGLANIAAHPALAGTAALIPDLPGCGGSERPRRPLGLTEIADRLAAWLRARGSAPCVILGHSMGGVIAVDLAERHRDVVAALIDVEGNLSPGDCTYSARVVAFDARDFATGGFEEIRSYIAERGINDRAHRGYAQQFARADPAAVHRHATELVAASAREDLAARLARLPMPVTYVAGVPGGTSARSRELLDVAGVRRVDVVHAGHWPFVDQPDRFAAAIAAILGPVATP